MELLTKKSKIYNLKNEIVTFISDYIGALRGFNTIQSIISLIFLSYILEGLRTIIFFIPFKVIVGIGDFILKLFNLN